MCGELEKSILMVLMSMTYVMAKFSLEIRNYFVGNSCLM